MAKKPKRWTAPDPPPPILLDWRPRPLPGVAFIDIETTSDLDLRKVAADIYLNDSSTKLVGALYKTADGVEGSRDLLNGAPPINGADLYAVNESFDRNGIERLADDAVKAKLAGCRWIDLAGIARALNLPGGLPSLLKELYGDRLAKGEMPKPLDPYSLFYEDDLADYQQAMRLYNARDIVAPEFALASLRKLFHQIHRDKAAERWRRMIAELLLDARINDAGWPIDVARCRRSAARVKKLHSIAIAELQQLLPKDDKGKPHATGRDAVIRAMQAAGWLPATGKFGLEQLAPLLGEDSIRGRVARACLTLHTPNARYQAALDQQRDGRIRNASKSNCQHSGRWSNKGAIVNMNRSKGKPLTNEEIDRASATALAADCRSIVAVKPGEILICRDLSSIEQDMMMYAIDQRDFIGVENMYERIAATIYGKKPEDIKNPSPERSVGKQCSLALNYGAGVDNLRGAISKALGRPIAYEEAVKAYKGFHKTFPKIRPFGAKLMDAWIGGGAGDLPLGVEAFKIKCSTGDARGFILPSGRALVYHRTALTEDSNGRHSWEYWTLPSDDDKIKAPMVRGRLWDSKCLPHVVSGMCRDLLADAMLAFDQMVRDAGINAQIVGHVHDEILVVAAERDAEQADQLLQQAMTATPAWLPGFKPRSAGDRGTRWSELK